MTDFFAKKPLDQLMEEARDTGSHSLKRTLGVFQLTALGVGAVIEPESSCSPAWARTTPGQA